VSGVQVTGAGEPPPGRVVRPDSDDEPTRYARVALRKADMAAEVIVPGGETFRMLQAVTYAICAIGAIVGPTLTVKIVPVG